MKFIFPIFALKENQNIMERIVIIDHDDHRLFIEDLNEEALRPYNGEEEAYIRDNYNLGEHWSWDYITRAEYYPNDFDDPIEVNFRDLL